ncbi:hypothetical protein AU210_016299 [Fusarium oxysporum f. sp. radicis-cucumerinum]|uniref:Uncharacterized protein n=1 Tax=Fusarium oxysporum f. sp. radicis-cucumerinum TaxID=327505 RepID=A0A2H3G6L2_FUSOX|nr:hypothetical protein AU210_016299 [Fusarium oxysporum f. sp. radicis-cucumerinum]
MPKEQGMLSCRQPERRTKWGWYQRDWVRRPRSLSCDERERRNMSGAQGTAPRQEAFNPDQRSPYVYTWPSQAVDAVERCRGEYVAQLRDWLIGFPPILALSEVHNRIESHASDVREMLSLDRVQASFTLLEAPETEQEAQKRRKNVFKSLLDGSYRPVTEKEKDDGGIPQLDVSLRPNEVLAFQCLLALVQSCSFIRQESNEPLSKSVHGTREKLHHITAGVTTVFVDHGGRQEQPVIVSYSSD